MNADRETLDLKDALEDLREAGSRLHVAATLLDSHKHSEAAENVREALRIVAEEALFCEQRLGGKQ